jgi:hypothetical protein
MVKYWLLIVILLILNSCGKWKKGSLAYLLDDRNIELINDSCADSKEKTIIDLDRICVYTADDLMTSSIVKVLKNDASNQKALITRHNYYYHASDDAWVSFDQLGELNNWKDIISWNGPKYFSAYSFVGGCFNWAFSQDGKFILNRKSVDNEECAEFEEKRQEFCFSQGNMQIQGRLVSLKVDSGVRAEFFIKKSDSKYCWLTSYEDDSLDCIEF